jgi:hypothetical protein
VILTRVGPRGADPAELAAAVAGRVPAGVIDDPRRAVADAVAAAAPEEAVLVTGSLYLVGEAYAALAEPGESLFQPWNGRDSGATEPAPCGSGGRSGTERTPGGRSAGAPRG